MAFILTVFLAGFEVLSYDDDYSMPIAKLTYSDTYLTHMDGPDWIVPLIEKVQEKDGSHILLLGDSVGRQLFIDLADINDEVCVAPAIAPFTVCGQYVLTRLYLDNHPDATDVYLVMVPMDDVSKNFNIEYAYQYVVMPLVETDTLGLLDGSTVDELRYLFGSRFMERPVVERIDNSGLNRKLYLNWIKDHVKNDYPHSLEESVYVSYLKKISGLCSEKGVTFHLLPAPVPDADVYHRTVEEKAPEYFESAGLDILFPDYLSNVRYYPEEMFSDGVHFGGRYEDQSVYNGIIREMYGYSGLTDHLKLE
jgi:hypothetical protein